MVKLKTMEIYLKNGKRIKLVRFYLKNFLHPALCYQEKKHYAWIILLKLKWGPNILRFNPTWRTTSWIQPQIIENKNIEEIINWFEYDARRIKSEFAKGKSILKRIMESSYFDYKIDF
jgi:hypothetical protein